MKAHPTHNMYYNPIIFGKVCVQCNACECHNSGALIEECENS
jgi:hypothetical protein